MEDDKLPQKICTNCSTKVKSACETKRMCIASDGLLRTKIKDELVYDTEPTIQEIEVNISHIGECFQMTEVFKSEVQSDFDDDSFQELDEDELAPKMKKPKPESFVCVFCDQTFRLIKLKDEHVKAEHPDERVCKICHKKRPTLKSTENCMRDHLFGLLHSCQVCGKNFVLHINFAFIQEQYTKDQKMFFALVTFVVLRRGTKETLGDTSSRFTWAALRSSHVLTALTFRTQHSRV